MSTGNCTDCMYAKRIGKDIGECRRWPPEIINSSIRNKIVTRFPEIAPDTWCGEFILNPKRGW